MRVKSKPQIKPLTKYQRQVVDYITEFYQKHGYSPSIREISNHFDKSTSTIHKLMKLAADKGYLQMQQEKPRGVVPVKQEAKTVEVPLLGYVAGGEPIEAIQQSEKISVPDFMLKSGTSYYALEVKGNSMRNDDIWDKDLILVKHQKTAGKNDVVIAYHPEKGVTIKRLGKIENGEIELIPSNPSFPPFRVPLEGFEVQGIFAGLIRRNLS